MFFPESEERCGEPWRKKKKKQQVLDALWPHKGTETKADMGRIRTGLNEVPELREDHRDHGTLTMDIN